MARNCIGRVVVGVQYVVVLYVPEMGRKENRETILLSHVYTYNADPSSVRAQQHRQIGVRWARFASSERE